MVDLCLTERWFREGFGLLPAGGSRMMMRGPLPSRVQGLPKAASTCWWLVGSNPWAQIELFQFESPSSYFADRIGTNATPPSSFAGFRWNLSSRVLRKRVSGYATNCRSSAAQHEDGFKNAETLEKTGSGRRNSCP